MRTSGLMCWLLLALAGCTLPPLRGKAQVGKDPYAVFVADVPGGSELFALLPDGGAPIPLTFSTVEESAPALSPDGSTVLFLRQQGAGAADRRTVWLLNLLSGAERELALPARLHAQPLSAAWSANGSAVYIRTDRGTVRAAAPPASSDPRMVRVTELPAADSSFLVGLGEPAFATVVDCAPALCLTDGEHVSPLASGARGAVRWGPDSVGYFRGNQFEVRPLGPGRERSLNFKPEPVNPRELTYFPGRR